MRTLSALAEQLRARGTGALAWTDGQRRRIVWLDAGEMMLLQSNLKSESIERVNELTPGLKPPELRLAALRARIAGFVSDVHGAVEWLPGEKPGKTDPADVIPLLWTADLPALPPASFPRTAPAHVRFVARFPTSEAVRSYLRDLDGSRPLDEVIEFSPADPEEIERGLRLAYALGAVDDGSARVEETVVRTVATERNFGGGVDDIASMIAGELTGAAKAVAADPLEVRFGSVLPRIRGAKDHFAVLGVSWQDPPETIRRAYFGLARELHPDRYSADSDEVKRTAEDIFDKVRAAWEMLGDDTKRDAYIAKVIRGEKTEEELAMEKVKLILDAEYDFKRGLNEFYAGRIAQAHELFQQCADAVPDEMEFSAYAGFTTFKTFHGRDNERAEAGASRVAEAIRARENLDAAHVLLGLIHRTKGDDASARQSFVQALKIKPSNPDALRELKRMEPKVETKEASKSIFGKWFKK